MISIQNLVFAYPRSQFQLSVDSLEIAAGQKVAVVGPSGSGKTTLINLIAGISVPDAGRVNVLNESISELSDTKRRDFRISKIGMVFQQFELVEYLNVQNNIMLPFLINRSLKKQKPSTSAATALAEQLGLHGKMGRYPNQLSQGEQQRVAICRAMITAPKIVLADEPTGNLDPSNKDKILDQMFAACERHQQTLVVVTHDMNILDGFDQVVDFEKFRERVQAG